MEGNRKMKLIIAFVKPIRLEDVRDAMEGVGVDSFSFAEVRGIGRHKGERDIYRGVEYAPSYVPMMQIIVAVKAEVAEDLMTAIAKAAKTDEPGNGKVLACDLTEVVDVSSGTTGPDAIRHREDRDT
jgi:nitrogen regulatory protein PII